MNEIDILKKRVEENRGNIIQFMRDICAIPSMEGQLKEVGERIGAERLQALGLVNRLAESGEALADALALADKLGQRAPNALASAKELLGEARSHSLNQHLAMERDHFVRNLHHANGGEGISAFLEKRQPQWLT